MVFGICSTFVLALACAEHPTAQPPSQGQTPPLSGQRGPGVPEFWVRPGFRVTVASDDLGEARFLQFDSKGNLYVSRPGAGDIWTLSLKGGIYQKVNTFISGKRSVHGMDFKDGWLWFTTSGAVCKARDTNGDGAADETVTVLDNLPNGGHWWRSILVTNDGFFTSIGDPGNITDQTNTDREKIWKYTLDGKSRVLWSSGIRNTEKLRFRPGTQELYGADHGSDNFGQKYGEQQGRNQPITDALPPCEFNYYVQGGFYGHPFLVGDNIPRPEYSDRKDLLELAAKAIPPAWSFGPHWAPNGWTFLTGSGLGTDYKGDALVAQHGSWNRVKKAGYRVERVLFDKALGTPFGGQMLVGTLTAEDRVVGRPVDVVEAPDGSVLFSDDQNNRIYRITAVK